MGDRAGFEAFYHRHHERVVRACALVVLDASEAEDIAAEAFGRLWARWGAIQGEDHAGGYVFKTAMRLCYRRGRRAARERVGVAERAAPDELDPVLSRHDVFEALRRLPTRQRQAVVLRDWAGYETHHVASLLGMRESTVRVHLARGREALRRVLSVEERGR